MIKDPYEVQSAMWKPISKTVPPDAEDVLFYWGNHVPPDVGIYLADFGTFNRANEDLSEYDAPPTHWMKIPEPPA